MKLIIPVIASSILHALLLSTIAAATNNDRNYLLSCGASSTVATNSWDGRTWKSDNNSTFSDNFSSTIVASASDSAVPAIPFSTARFFSSNFTYSFPVYPGPKFIRLFFYPSTYSSPSFTFPATDAYLTVQSNSGHLLLRNFSAYDFNSSDTYFSKEFYVHVSEFRLQLTFLPTQPRSHAFVNGIEILSVPENLYVDSANPPENVVHPSITFYLGNTTALETAYRLNVGGQELSLSQDSGSMSRKWLNDDPYLISAYHGKPASYDNTTAIKYPTQTPNYSAPAEVYETARWMGPVSSISTDLRRRLNVTWGLEVDLGFYYLVRLHWCEIARSVNSAGFRVFDVYVNDLLAERAADIYYWANGGNTAIYRNYVVLMDANGNENKGVLQIAMHPNTDTLHLADDILLNGLEIFKINQTNGNLDAPNPNSPFPTTTPQVPRPKLNSSNTHMVPAIIGAIAGAILIVVTVCYLFIFRRRKWSKTSGGSSGTNSTKSKLLFSFGKSTATTKRSSGGGGSSLPSHLCRHFSLAEIRLATSDFSQSLIIGHGGFGNVYKGTVNTDTGPTTVAIKRLNPLSGQGAREFTTEIELLSKLRHVHLVSLIGYCDDAGEMILVYEFMSRGTLREHLYPNSTGQMMPWCQRLQACVGAARGLHYLHTGTERMIIHRDVKSTNILVDESWVAKVSDFGLSKLGPVGGELSHVSTHVKGSFGYVDPEYYRRQQLTEKSDVYSFGVVLFEVLCGRAAVNPNLPKEQVNLRIWARKNQLSGTLHTIVDPNLKGQIAPECLRKFGEVAESCVRDEGANRPSMVDVIWGLEFALQLQLESAAKITVNGDYKTDTVCDENVATTNMGSPITDPSARLIRCSEENSNWSSINNSSSGLFSNTTLHGGDGGSTDVFSQIFKPEGR